MVRSLLIACLLLTVPLAPAAAQDAAPEQAQDTRTIEGVEVQGDVSADDLEAARSYRPWGEAFGQDKLAYMAIDENKARMMIVFLGDGETLKNWTRMVTINIFGLPADEDAQREATFKYIDGFRGFVAAQKEKGELAVELKGFAGFTKDKPAEGETAEEAAKDAQPQHALYQFAIGKEKPDEDNAGIIFPLDGRLVNFQIQRRDGKTVTEQEVNQLSNFLMIQVNGGLTPEMRAALEKQAAEKKAAP